MSKRILFIAIDPNDNSGQSMKIYECRDIGYLAGYLRGHGHIIKVYSEEAEKIDFSILDSFEPDIVCLPVNTDSKIINWAKAKRPDVLICKGTGSTPADLAANWLKYNDYLDYVITGGETFYSWLKLLESIESGTGLNNVKGIVFRDGKEITETTGSYDFDINELITSDLDSNRNQAYITTSFGCIGNCSFCGEKVLHRKWKGRDIKRVVDEIEYFVRNGVYRFHFTDACIEAPDVNLKRLTALCQEIINRNLPILYEANFRPDFSKKATTEIMDLLVRSGLYRAFIGVESGCQDDLSLFNKRCTIKEARETVELFERYNINVDIGFIMFHPFSTLASLKQNIELLDDMGKASFKSLSCEYTPVIGAGLYNKARDAGLLNENTLQLRFQNNAVQDIHILMKSFLDTIDKEAKKTFDGMRGNYGHYIYLMNVYYRNNMLEHYEATQSYLDRMRSMIKTVSILLCNWFRALLSIAEQGFDPDKAIRASFDLINPSLLKALADCIQQENEKIDNSLRSLNKQV